MQLITSCAKGEVVAIQYCIKQRADPNFQDVKTQSALLIAAHCGHDECVRVLLEYRADVHLRRTDGATPLYQAAANGHASVVKRLVDAKSDIEARTTETNSTPLLAAARNGKDTSVLALIELSADPNSRNAMGATPLHLAVFASHAKSVRILLDHGANVRSSIKKGPLAGTVPEEVS
jgi:ankyrin repeat protein